MYSKAKRLVPAVLLVSCLMGGCGFPGNANPAIASLPLESYTESESSPGSGSAAVRNPYTWMTPVTLKLDETSLTTFFVRSDQSHATDTEAESTNHGIAMSYALEKQDAADALTAREEKEKEAIRTRIGNGTISEEKGSGVVTLSYAVEDKSAVYPCMTVIKAESVENEISLISSLTIDNTRADDQTSAVVKEALSILGISLQTREAASGAEAESAESAS